MIQVPFKNLESQHGGSNKLGLRRNCENNDIYKFQKKSVGIHFIVDSAAHPLMPDNSVQLLIKLCEPENKELVNCFPTWQLDDRL